MRGADALKQAADAGEQVSLDDVRSLGLIDRMKARLIGPEDAEKALTRYDYASRIARADALYENELRRLNALDFNSLVFDTYQLFACGALSPVTPLLADR
jgi:DNA helicase-2/ATP-dependent DNA helicase PcrA